MERNPGQEKLRVDRWLWAARFFKTRSLAKSAIENGKIELNGNRIKASKEIAQGDLLSVRRGDTVQVVTVLALTDKRGSATIAQGLYEETEQSILERAIVTEKKENYPSRLLFSKKQTIKERPTQNRRTADEWGHLQLTRRADDFYKNHFPKPSTKLVQSL